MFSQSFPFFNHYWPFLLIGFIFYVLGNVFAKSSKVVRHTKQIFKQSYEDSTSLEKELEEETELEQDELDDEFVPALPSDLQHIPFVYTRPSPEQLVQRTQEFYELVAARRSIRSFSSDPVSKDIIRTAPSGAHTEPWTFVLVSDVQIKAQIREIVEREEEVNYKRRMGKQWTTDLKPLRTNWIKEYLTTAPYLILVFKQMYGLTESGERKNHYYHDISVAIACGILITAIQAAGLVTVVSTPLNGGPSIRKILNRPANEKLVLVFPVGYPASDATMPDLHRKHLSEILVEF
ncbi:iodotyrosine deiodinase 1 isoform X2 [Athalia rosae]|uniref:iodotyrosine deiodinase 1 isoform X2 n=1 Tax=Athalia rosae TaxID=37344 RepID=UPI0020334EF8|nr:iodotyrosine deiodinase 1 isoform X2 [Athalia rosae]